jgi:hypothetical protein
LAAGRRSAAFFISATMLLQDGFGAVAQKVGSRT